MKLIYDSTLDDVVETATRTFMRTPAYATNRWRGALLCAAGFAVFGFLGFKDKDTVNLPVVCIAAAAWGAGLFLLIYKSAVRRRIASYAAGELTGEWPRATHCVIENGQLVTTTFGTRTAYELAELSRVNEDTKVLELSFGPLPTCTIPLRAFDCAEEKAEFLAAIRRE